MHTVVQLFFEHLHIISMIGCVTIFAYFVVMEKGVGSPDVYSTLVGELLLKGKTADRFWP